MHLPSANMHCPSCVSTISSILESYLPRQDGASHDLEMGRSRPDTSRSSGTTIGNIDISLLNGVVSFDHPPDLDLSPIVIELQDSGFEVNEDASDPPSSTADLHSSRWWNLLSSKPGNEQRKKHKQFCEACKSETSLVSQRPSTVAKGKKAARGWRQSTFSVEGMTCS
jgi:copper chaperone CopZ